MQGVSDLRLDISDDQLVIMFVMNHYWLLAIEQYGR